MLEKINNNKNVNVLSSVKKCDVIRTTNLQIVTRQGTKNGLDNPQISKIRSNEYYSNPAKQKHVYNDASNIYKNYLHRKTTDDSQHKITK